jgi:hypothetical protein
MIIKKKSIAAFLTALSLCLLLLSGCGSTEAKEWTRTGYFSDENNNFLTVNPSDEEEYEGFYVGLMIAGDSFGWYLPQEGDSLHGTIPGDQDEEITVTVSEEGDDGLLVKVDSGETYHFLPTADEDTSSEDAGYYSMVTSMSKKNVEAFARTVRDAYLNGDWAEIAELISYPITLYPDVTVNNADEFLAYTSDKVVDDSDRQVMEEETCENMFVNGQGICMGSGQIWLSDVATDISTEMNMHIIAVSGLVEK